MPRADVVVIGAGLAGLTAAARLAEAGASVALVAKGHASTHWGAGGIDVAAPDDARTPAEGVADAGRCARPPLRGTGRRRRHRRPPGSRACWPRPGCRTRARPRRRSAASPPRSAAPAGSPSFPRRRPRRSGRGSPTRCWSSPGRPGSRTSGPPRSRTACRATPCGTALTGPRGSWASPWSWMGSRAAATSTRSSSPTGSTTPSDGPRTSTASRSRWDARPAGGRAGSHCRRSSGCATTPRRGRMPAPRSRSTRSRSRSSRPACRASACGRRSGRGSGPAAGASRWASRSTGSRSLTAGWSPWSSRPRPASTGSPPTRSSSPPAASRAAGSSARSTAGSWSRCSGCRSRRRPRTTGSGARRWTRPATRSSPPASAPTRSSTRSTPTGRVLRNVFVVGALLAGQRALRERCGDGVAVASGWRAATTILDGPPAAAEARTPVGASTRSRRTAR